MNFIGTAVVDNIGDSILALSQGNTVIKLSYRRILTYI